jgi:osmoprotectant transport system ATP-binding protein
VLELRAVRKGYGPRTALDNLSLIVPPARCLVLIGPSGCGKSTLLRLMNGLIEPDAGEVRYDGALLTAATAPALRRRMGYVIQDGGLFPHLTARGNVTLMARYLRWPSSRMASRLMALAELTRFPADGLDRHAAQLSGGQRQRVALMRALMLDPEVLLLDEPLGALDPIVRADLQEDLRRIFRDLGKTVVLVTHDLGEAAFFGDRIVLMKDGGIVQAGTLADLLHSPADPFVTRFINAQRRPLDDTAAGPA